MQHRYHQNYIAFRALLKREVWRFLHVWSQTLLPPLITSALYFIIFGHLIGSQLAPIDNLPYIRYIAPGLVMMWVIMAAYNNTTSSFFFAKFQRSIEEMLVSPMANFAILAGYIGGAIVRAFLVAVLIVGVTLFFTHLSIQHSLITILAILLSATLFALLGLINGIYAKTFDDIMMIPTFILTPLSYLGGIFYSIKMLPPFWQMLSLFNPIIYITAIFRYGMLGVSDINVALALAILMGCNILLIVGCLYLLKKGVGIRN